MKINDFVRAIHEPIEGRIISLSTNQKNAVIEDQDGFQHEFLVVDLVAVSKDESYFFPQKYRALSAAESAQAVQLQANMEKKHPALNEKPNLRLSFVPFNDDLYDLYFVNESKFVVLFSCNILENNAEKGLFYGVTTPLAHQKLAQWKLSDFDHWPKVKVYVILFDPNTFSSQAHNFSSLVSFTRKSFLSKDPQTDALLEKKAISVPIELKLLESPAVQIVDKQVLKEKIVDSKQSPKPIQTLVEKPKDIVDLHAEKIPDLDYQQLSAPEILAKQLVYFDKLLNRALVHLTKSVTGNTITFIHGVGNGTLKQEIEKRLKKLRAEKKITTYYNAPENKFGRGAITVQL